MQSLSASSARHGVGAFGVRTTTNTTLLTATPPTLGCARLRAASSMVMRMASAAPCAMPVSRLHFAPSAARAERQVPARAAAAAAAAASSPAAEDDDEVEDDDEFEEDEYEEDDSPPPPVDEAALQLAVDLARTASDTKAADVMVLDVAPLVSWTSYLVIASVNSRPQLMAVLARCEQKALEVGVERRNNPTGRSQWECVDLGSVVVHAMTPAQREAYALEDFYGAADEVQWWEDGEEGMEEEEKGGVGAWTTRTKGQ